MDTDVAQLLARATIAASHMTSQETLSLLQALSRSAPAEALTHAHLLGVAYMQGVEIPWHMLYPERRVISLPGYAFQGYPHWANDMPYSPCLRDRYMEEHQIHNQALLPAAMALSLMARQNTHLTSLRSLAD